MPDIGTAPLYYFPPSSALVSCMTPWPGVRLRLGQSGVAISGIVVSLLWLYVARNLGAMATAAGTCGSSGSSAQIHSPKAVKPADLVAGALKMPYLAASSLHHRSPNEEMQLIPKRLETWQNSRTPICGSTDDV
jgi:hypothetical protein